MRKTKGITLIALIITIIIMLILVAVSISILINSGLIGKAKEAGKNTKSAYEEESRLGDSISIDGVEYDSIDEFLEASNSESLQGLTAEERERLSDRWYPSDVDRHSPMAEHMPSHHSSEMMGSDANLDSDQGLGGVMVLSQRQHEIILKAAQELKMLR
jgi:hypothetical protein